MKNVMVTLIVASLSVLCPCKRARAAVVEPDLASRDWSASVTHNLASNPPTAASLQAFVYTVEGSGVIDPSAGKVCDFTFADLRHSGSLSLVVSMQGGGNGDCNITDIIDKTPAGFEDYTTNAVPEEETVGESIKDINKDGNLELILSGPIWVTGEGAARQECDWPLVFAWNGNGYADVSEQYKGYYKGYLKDLDEQIAAASEQTPAATYTTIPMVVQAPSNGGPPPGPAFVKVPVPATSLPVESAPDFDLACGRIQVAKTEQFLGFHSDATMSTAIKDSESQSPDRRILATIIFSFVGSQEAKADLKTLANDPDVEVAKTAKDRLSDGLAPVQYYREVTMEQIKWPPAKH
jgi:hypothetical protein